MSNKTINSRIMNKVDKEVVWQSKTDFIPLKGEVIIYDVDENYPKPRMKVGDGERPIHILPFVSGFVEETNLIAIPYPYQSNTLTYNGSSQSVVWANYDTTKMTLEGSAVTSATNAGEYQVTFTPKSGYCWENNNSTEPYVTSWKINKIKTVFEASAMSIDLAEGQQGSLTIRYTPIEADGGRPSASFEESLITLVDESVDIQCGKTVETVYSISVSNAALVGPYSITFRTVEKTNYAAGEITVVVNYTGAKSLNDYTWQEIADIAAAGTATDYFSIGDIKLVGWPSTVIDAPINIMYNGELTTSISASDVPHVYIVDFNHQSNTGIQFGTFKKYNKDLGIHGSWMSDASTSGGWRDSYLRYKVLGSSSSRGSLTAANPMSPAQGSLLSLLPEDLRSVMQPMLVYTNNVGSLEYTPSTNSVSSTEDILPLLSEYEVFGENSNGLQHNSEQSQYAYYYIGNPKTKFRHYDTENSAAWWLRDPATSVRESWCAVGSNGYPSADTYDTMNMFAPVFTVCSV